MQVDHSVFERIIDKLQQSEVFLSAIYFVPCVTLQVWEESFLSLTYIYPKLHSAVSVSGKQFLSVICQSMLVKVYLHQERYVGEAFLKNLNKLQK